MDMLATEICMNTSALRQSYQNRIYLVQLMKISVSKWADFVCVKR